MAIKFNRSQTFATNGTVTAAGLHNLVDGLDIYQALITDQTNLTSVGTADELLIADADLTANDPPRAVTVQELFNDALTVGTYTDANFTANLTYGTATGNRTVSTNASITTGTINNATLGTTTGTAATFTNATATSANITNGTIQTLTSSTATITGGTFSGLLNSSTGTFSGSINSTLGTIGTLNSTTGTIGNFSTTLAGDLTISQGTATLGTTGVTAGTYGTNTAAVTLTLDAKGRVTTVSTSAIQATPASNSVTPAMLTQPLTLATAVATTSGTSVTFTDIPSWVKRITIMFNGVSLSGTDDHWVRIGTASGIETTGYLAVSDASAFTTAFGIRTQNATLAVKGAMVLTTLGSNVWVMTTNTYLDTGTTVRNGSGSKTLGGTLTQVQIRPSGTDTFDAGSVNIMYEG